MMELVDMNSLGLFDFIEFYPFKSDLPYIYNLYTNINYLFVYLYVVD